ncbi:MAG: alpha-ketoacid dehydrogenase subunit beta [Candidatus Micrarchaeia archaeon]
MVEAVNQALHQEMQRDPTVIVLGEDVGKDGGVFRATQGLWNTFGEARVLDTPLAESGIVGVSIGMAVNGLRPVAELQFDGFTYLAFQQIINHAARMRNRSRGRFTCPMVIRAPYGGGVRALEHHSESMEALWCHIPGIKVVIPSTPVDAKGLLVASIRDPDPVFFFEPKRLYRAFREEVPDELYDIPLGKAKLVKEGSDVTLVSWGSMMRTTIEATEEIEKEGTSCELIDLRTLSPLDDETLMASVRKTGRVVVVEEEPRSFSVAAEIITRINEKAFLSLEAPPARVASYDVPVPYPKLEDYYLPNPLKIKKAVKEAMSY